MSEQRPEIFVDFNRHDVRNVPQTPDRHIKVDAA